MNFESTESERAAMHGLWRSTPLCLVVAISTTGCQLLKQCAREDCNEIHVKAPPQKVVVNVPREEACEPIPRAKTEDAPSRPQSAPSQPQSDQRSMPMSAPMSAPMAAPMAAPGYAAVPTLPGGLALGLSFDWIRISIPIPRLRTMEMPPEPSMSFVAMGGAAAAPVMPAMPMGYMQQQGGQQACYTPEQITEAVAMLRRQQGGNSNGGGSSNTSMEAELAKRERELEDKAKRLDDAAKKLDGLLNKVKETPPNSTGEGAEKSADKSAAKERGGWR